MCLTYKWENIQLSNFISKYFVSFYSFVSTFALNILVLFCLVYSYLELVCYLRELTPLSLCSILCNFLHFKIFAWNQHSYSSFLYSCVLSIFYIELFKKSVLYRQHKRYLFFPISLATMVFK